MAIFSLKRHLLLSLRQHFISPLNLKSIPVNSRPISTSIIHSLNPNFISSTSNPPKTLTLFKFPPLIHKLSSKITFNGVRTFATLLSESSNRPPKETIVLDGCDFEHWLVVVEAPNPELTRDEIIDGYIRTLAQIIGSEEEARMKIYSVSTRHYFAFGALISEELSYKLKELPNVRWVLPDSYMDVPNKTYAGEPFINGQAVPYDPRYHEVWIRNHEESLRNNMKNRRRQKDSNSQSRSPASVPTRGSSSGRWISSPISQNQSSGTLNTQNPKQAPLTYSQNQSPNQAPPAYSPNQASPTYSPNQASPAYSPNQASPAYSRNQAPPTYSRNQAPPTYSQNQAFQPSGMHDNTMSRVPPPPTQGWGGQSHIGAPPGGIENEARQSYYMQNQTPPPSSTSVSYDPARDSRFQSWETSTGYQSPTPQTPIEKHNSSYYNPPPSVPSNINPYHQQTWGPASGYQIQTPPHPTSKSFSYDNVPPSAHAGRTMPSQVQPNEYSHRNIPHQAPNDFQQQQFQDNYSSYNAMHTSKSLATPGAQNYQNPNMPPSSAARDMPSNNWNQQSRWEAPSETQQSGYYSNSPQQVQNGRARFSQYQQYEHNSRGVESSTATRSPQGWNYPSTNPIDNPRPMQNIEYRGSTSQNPGYDERIPPNDTSLERRQTRYEDRGFHADDYRYASK